MSSKPLYFVGAAIVIALLLNGQANRYQYVPLERGIVRFDNLTTGICFVAAPGLTSESRAAC